MKKFILVLMLVVIFAIAYSYTAAVRFCDEDDILTASWLISNGYVLYKDIFSHHMPLPYYIMSIPNLFLNPLSFDIFRCFFYIFIGSVFIFFNFYDKNGLRNFWLLIYIIILLLSFPLFNGYWVLADTFFALGALAVFISVLNNPECNFSIKEMIVISSGVAFCILSTLISVYPVLFFLVYYFTIRFIKNDCKYSFQLLKEDAKFIGILSCPFLIWIVYTIFTDGFRDFIQNAYLFNTKYYSLFTGMNTPVTLILNHIQNITDLFKNINFTTVIFYLAFLYFMLKLIIKDKKYNLALFSFIFVPLVCVFGVFISNGLLATIDRATRVNDALTISGQVFSASAMSSNRVRVDSDFASKLSSDTSLNFNGTFIDDANLQYYSSKSAAEKIDDAFASKLAANGHSINAPSSKYSHMFNMPSPGTITYFDYMNTDLVFVYYDLQKFNWLFAFASCFFITAALLVAALGVIQRLFELTILFAVSPPFIALMPLDDGKAFKGWAKKFIESTVILYGTVVALNFFFIVAPIFQNIDLFGSPEEFAYYGKATCDLFNSIAQILFIMCASLLIKDFSSLITQLVTGNDKAVGLEGKGGNVKGAIGASMGAAAGAAAAGAAVSAKTHKAWKDYNSVENKQARKEQKDERKREKQNKRDATERRDARYKVLNAQHDAGEITTKDYLRASRRIQDDYRKEMGEKETMRTRARNVGSNIRTKVTGEPEREMGKAGKERLKNIYDKADQIKKDKDDYREQRKNLPLKDRANPIRKAKEIYYGDSKKTLKAYKSSEKTNYKEDINNTVAGLNLQYALGNIDSEEYKKDIKEVTKDRKNELRNKKNNK